LHPGHQRGGGDEAEVAGPGRRTFADLDVDLLATEPQRPAAVAERLDLHAEHSLVEGAGRLHVADGEIEVVDALHAEGFHAGDSIRGLARTPGRGRLGTIRCASPPGGYRRRLRV